MRFSVQCSVSDIHRASFSLRVHDNRDYRNGAVSPILKVRAVSLDDERVGIAFDEAGTGADLHADEGSGAAARIDEFNLSIEADVGVGCFSPDLPGSRTEVIDQRDAYT